MGGRLQKLQSERLIHISNFGKNLISICYIQISHCLRAARSGDRIPVWARFFAHFQTGLGDHPASCTKGTGSFPGVKRSGRGADHPPASNAEVKKEKSYTPNPLWAFGSITGYLYLYLYTKKCICKF
jgi:hypothetical protein